MRTALFYSPFSENYLPDALYFFIGFMIKILVQVRSKLTQFFAVESMRLRGAEK